MYRYVVKRTELRLLYNCDYKGCKQQVLYAQKLTEKQLQSLRSAVQQLRLDTLRPSYVRPGFDGREVDLVIRGRDIPSVTVHLERYQHPIVETFLTRLDSLISNAKYHHNRL